MKNYLTILFFFLIVTQTLAQKSNPTPMQDWKYPYEVQKVSITDSIEIAYIDEGKGKTTLLFIHGLGSNLQAWQKNIDFLKKNYRCIALDLPGYGKSSKKDYAFDMSFFAESIQTFMQQLNLNQVVLIGHSMGGQIAMHLALNNPQTISELILMAPAGFEVFTEEESTWFQNFYTPGVVKATPEVQIAKNFQLNFYEMPEDAQFMIDDRLQMRQSEEYDYYCNMIPQCVLGMLHEPVFEQLSVIDLPTLIVFGKNDLLIPNKFLHPSLTTLEVAQGGQKRISNSILKMIPLAGHFVQWEQANLVNQEIQTFLNYNK